VMGRLFVTLAVVVGGVTGIAAGIVYTWLS
jgi:hypothetical protein